FCDFCKKQGHTKEKSFKLHGYPQQFNRQGTQNYNSNNYNKHPKNNRGRNITANVVAGTQTMTSNTISNQGEDLENQGGNNNQSVSLSREQYDQVVRLLQHFQNDGAENSSNARRANAIVNFAGNFAGIVTCTSSIDFDKLSCKCFQVKADLWILDSGASHHMTFNKTHLQNIVTLPYPLLVKLPNGYKVKVTEIGTVTLTPKIVLYKVLFVPTFKYNLISISSLTAH
ncbi:hypothetical protein A4A49_60689, partial [Nicotiana attenuata]